MSKLADLEAYPWLQWNVNQTCKIFVCSNGFHGFYMFPCKKKRQIHTRSTTAYRNIRIFSFFYPKPQIKDFALLSWTVNIMPKGGRKQPYQRSSQQQFERNLLVSRLISNHQTYPNLGFLLAWFLNLSITDLFLQNLIAPLAQITVQGIQLVLGMRATQVAIVEGVKLHFHHLTNPIIWTVPVLLLRL